jgi:hypothetical protein
VSYSFLHLDILCTVYESHLNLRVIGVQRDLGFDEIDSLSRTSGGNK